MTEIIIGDSIYIPGSFEVGDGIPLDIVTIEQTGGTETPAVVWNQTIAMATWTITHSFSRPPIVTIIDSTGKAIYTDIDYPNGTTVVLTFSLPITGKAILR